ncbi:hypothetical protein ABPG74_006997 [Tetrahymena malaccensis]
MKFSQILIPFLINTIIIFCSYENETQLCNQSNEMLTFQRGYIYLGYCLQIRSQNSEYIVINNQGYDQNQPIFWNSNGIQSENSFSMYQIQNDILSIKIYNLVKYTKAEIQITQIKNIQHVSQSNDQYYYYFTDKQDNAMLYFISQNMTILKLKLSQKPNLISLNMFTSDLNKCLYKIYITLNDLIEEQIFCLENEDVFEEIQYFGDDKAILSSKFTTFVFNYNKIEYIMPNTNIYLFSQIQRTNPTKIIDLSESFQNIQGLPKFNYNYQYQEGLYFLMSLKDPNSENSQKEIKISKQQFQRKYEIDFRDSLGAGSYGDVYKVKNKHKEIIKNQDILSAMPDYYACKQIFTSEQGDFNNSSAFHEIEVLEKLKKYEYVIKLQNYSVENRSTYIILDLAESTLQEQINQKQANLEKYNHEEIVKFLYQIGKTLALIYSDERIAHRDLKPSNILIRQGNYQLSDFGCAQKFTQSEQFRDNLAYGTLKWMAPELREKKKDETVDFFKSDVFSLGMILLYMLTLSDISQVNCDEYLKQAKIRLMKNNYKDPIYNQIIHLITKMLEFNPDERPDSPILIQAIQEIESNQRTNL